MHFFECGLIETLLLNLHLNFRSRLEQFHSISFGEMPKSIYINPIIHNEACEVLNEK